MPNTSVALRNVRAFLIVVVLAFHSVLAYLDALPAAADRRFDAPPYTWLMYPIVDGERWFGFDLFCAWSDVYMMSLMFFLSGLFVWPSLNRKGSAAFLRHRALRLGVPFVLAFAVLMPVALYPSYRAVAADPSLAAYRDQFLALPFWPSGPQWFLAVLLVFDLAAAAARRLWPGLGRILAGLSAAVGQDPRRFFVALVAASALAYVPLALIYSPWAWFQHGPFAFQFSRPLHYAVYFFAGLVIGAHGLDRGLLATTGSLARRWRLWLTIAVATFGLWVGPTALTLDYGDAAPLALQVVANLGFVLACAGSSMFVLAVLLRFAARPMLVWNAIADNAYGMYLIHYVAVVWLQYALLSLALPAVAKGALAITGTLVLSLGAAAAINPLLALASWVARRVLTPSPLPAAADRASSRDDLDRIGARGRPPPLAQRLSGK